MLFKIGWILLAVSVATIWSTFMWNKHTNDLHKNCLAVMFVHPLRFVVLILMLNCIIFSVLTLRKTHHKYSSKTKLGQSESGSIQKCFSPQRTSIRPHVHLISPLEFSKFHLYTFFKVTVRNSSVAIHRIFLQSHCKFAHTSGISHANLKKNVISFQNTDGISCSWNCGHERRR